MTLKDIIVIFLKQTQKGTRKTWMCFWLVIYVPTVYYYTLRPELCPQSLHKPLNMLKKKKVSCCFTSL